MEGGSYVKPELVSLEGHPELNEKGSSPRFLVQRDLHKEVPFGLTWNSWVSFGTGVPVSVGTSH